MKKLKFQFNCLLTKSITSLLFGSLFLFSISANGQAFSQHTIDGNFNGAVSVYATDVDNDGDIDVLGAAQFANDIVWWENNGSESFTKHTISGSFNGAICVYATDVDSDGDVDVLGAAQAADDITWWENDGNESFTEHTIENNFDGATSVYATDVDGDGDIDVLGAAQVDDDIIWWENNGNESFTEHTIDASFNSARWVYATDMDGDGDVDVLGAAINADDITWWENDGNESFTEHTISGLFDGAYSVHTADIDGDGDVDVLGAAVAADDITWWENDGNEFFTEHTINGSFDGAYSVYATDLNGDGYIDVLGAANGADDITWWENLGPLPVELLFIEARQYKDDVLIEWQTASEENNAGFRIERSADVQYWETLDFVSGKGTTSDFQSYQFTDTRPIIGTNYYRLRQEDFNGIFEYSDIVSVVFEEDMVSVKIFPNPVQNGTFTLQYPGDQIANVYIIDPLGKIVFEQTVTGTTALDINLSAGVYFIQLTSFKSQWMEKLVVR